MGLSGDKMSVIRRFVRDESGATAIEYALIAGILFLGIVTAVTNYAARANLMYNNIVTNMR